MSRFRDERLEAIYQTRYAPQLPLVVVARAHRLSNLLMAATTWSDVGVFTEIYDLGGGRFAAPAHGRWFVTFDWDDNIGATAMDLERP